MDILGVGPLELFFILIIALIVLGPKDMVKAGRTLGRFLRQIVTSEGWSTAQQVSREIRGLPNRLIREAGLEEAQKEFSKVKKIGIEPITESVNNLQKDISDWTSPQLSTESSEEIHHSKEYDIPEKSLSTENLQLDESQILEQQSEDELDQV